MKKLLVFVCGLFFVSQSFATGIDSGATNADCDSDTLGQTSGTVNMEMDWQPNTIQIRWYNGNTLINTTNGAENSCVYDDDLYLPATPTRKGYTFEGWEVHPQMDFSTIPTNPNGSECWAIGQKNSANYCLHREENATEEYMNGVECNSDIEYTKLQRYEWGVKFGHGNIYGVSMCSITNGGSIGAPGIPSATKGEYCWCQMSGYKPANQTIIYAPETLVSWVHDQSAGNITNCEIDCAAGCAFFTRRFSSFRTALFTPASN